jgi:indole-3-glycerol phosphate synthase
MDKLDEIMAHKRRELAGRMRPVSEAELARAAAATPRPPSFAAALRRADGRLAVIAEIKRRSPSAGDIRPGISAPEQADRYAGAGADALSVLTDEAYFGGTLADLESVTASLARSGRAVPALRKDFLVHPLQVLEARAAGASAVLLIVRALDRATLQALWTAAQTAGLDALFEVHNEAEIEVAVAAGARIIGVNNRDLAVFRTDLALSERLIPRIPREVIAISESGIFTGPDAARVRGAGAKAVLVGEALMKSAEPGQLIAEFRRS